MHKPYKEIELRKVFHTISHIRYQFQVSDFNCYSASKLQYKKKEKYFFLLILLTLLLFDFTIYKRFTFYETVNGTVLTTVIFTNRKPSPSIFPNFPISH